MNEGFGLDDDHLQAHARAVEDLARRMRQVVAAGRYAEQLTDEAFGLIGEVFAAAARQGMAQGLRDVSSLAETGTAMARGLDAVATCYRDAERTNSGMFGDNR